MKDNIVREKSFDFALMIIDLYKELTKQKEFILSKQLLRSGTSVGANIEEAIGSHSRKDFFYRISIAYREARESRYWLRLLERGGYLTRDTHSILFDTCGELCRILGKIQLTLKQDTQSLCNNR